MWFSFNHIPQDLHRLRLSRQFSRSCLYFCIVNSISKAAIVLVCFCNRIANMFTPPLVYQGLQIRGANADISGFVKQTGPVVKRIRFTVEISLCASDRPKFSKIFETVQLANRSLEQLHQAAGATPCGIRVCGIRVRSGKRHLRNLHGAALSPHGSLQASSSSSNLKLSAWA
jgi:hypothetical protein